MADLDYGYEITIKENATFDPTGTLTNQWQRQIKGNTNWDDVTGRTGETYEVSVSDRSAKIRLKQTNGEISAYSNSLQVTSKDPNAIPPFTGNFGNILGSAKYIGGVLHPNGKVYAVPYKAEPILEIDPDNQTIREIPWPKDLPKNVTPYCRGGVLGPDGKVYFLPGLSMVEIYDPTDDTWDSINLGHLATYDDVMWDGGVVAPNGRIYLMPSSVPEIAEVDPVAKTSAQFGNYGMGILKYSGAVLHPNGKIYGIPNQATQVLEIDPGDGVGTSNPPTHSTFASSPIDRQFSGGFLAPDGKIYALGDSSTSGQSRVLIIDPDARTTQVLQIGHGGSYGSCMAPNGKSYSMPSGSSRYDHNQIIIFDPNTKYISTKSITGGSSYIQWRFNGTVLTNTGKIVGIPYNSTSVEVFDLGYGLGPWAVTGLPGNILDPLSPYFNKF